ncbi:MAG TPA: plastocyanin/azurin family copper-binding protein [Acidimicrobiia bacterium]
MNTYRGRRRLQRLAIGSIVAAPLLAGVMPPVRAATTTVIERGTQFVPKQVTVAPNDTVVWTFESGPNPGHTVTFDDGTDLNRNCPPSLLLNDCQDAPGEIVQRRFTVPGTYPYVCKIHRASGMTGVVVVAAPSSTTATTAPPSSTSTTQKATSTTAKPTSSTTTTTRPLATSSTMVPSSTTTTTSEATSVLLPGEPPPFTDETSAAANKSAGGKEGNDSGTVALIVGLLMAVSAGGGLLLWRLRPGRP